MLERASLYFHTIRYLKPSQILWRLLADLKKAAGMRHLPEPPPNLHSKLNPHVTFNHNDPWNSVEQIKEGRVCLLNHSEQLGWPLNWNTAGLPLLWQFNLHYFNYLYLLNREDQVEICTDWIRKNPVGKEVGWHPYPTSLRIVNWCKVGLDTPELLNSLYQQASYLSRNVESYHPGNHLLENAKALIFAGCYLENQGEAPRWLQKGLQIYRQQTPLQVLSDGGYFERSPMYHALMLEDYLDIINILPQAHPDLPLFIEPAKRMSDFIFSVNHPDGNIALFNDATREIALPTRKLLQYSQELLNYRAEKKDRFNDSGYYIHESPDVYLIIDGGAIGPDFLPAHAHADIFSFELSLKQLPIIVDSGVFEYPAGQMRSYVRSTRAHNTVCIDRVDQAQCWGSFRVARRFAPYNVAFYRNGKKSKFEGYFDGYARLVGDGIVHKRVITCDDREREIIIQDEVKGRGKHLVESLLHLHPEVSVEQKDGRVLLRRDEVKCLIDIGGQNISLEDGWYCPEFGLKIKNKVLVVGGKQSLPTRFSCKIQYQ